MRSSSVHAHSFDGGSGTGDSPAMPKSGAAAPQSPAAGHSLHLNGVSHYYGQVAAVQDVDLEVRAGELVALLGPSGCGKTTLLRAIAGFVNPTQGDILVDGRSIRNIPVNRRNMGLVFQNYALFPHMTIFENVAYGLRARRAASEEMKQRAGAMLELVQLSHLAGRRPGQLSGGQQQRVALARSLAVQPRILLLDEPLSALDKNLRLDMQIEIRRIQREFGITTLIVTHDQEEAMTMSDRIAVLEDGRVQQFASPTDVYDEPANMFVNEFIGTTNILSGELVHVAHRSKIRLENGSEVTVSVKVDGSPGDKVVLSVRPEGFAFCQASQSELHGRVTIAMPLGPSIIYDVVLDEGPAVKIVVPRSSENSSYAEGEQVSLALVGDRTHSVFRG